MQEDGKHVNADAHQEYVFPIAIVKTEICLRHALLCLVMKVGKMMAYLVRHVPLGNLSLSQALLHARIVQVVTPAIQEPHHVWQALALQGPLDPTAGRARNVRVIDISRLLVLPNAAIVLLVRDISLKDRQMYPRVYVFQVKQGVLQTA